MTLIAFFLSVILGCASLSHGFSQADMINPARWFVLFAIAWIVLHWRKHHWFSSFTFFIMILDAAYGVWDHFPAIWMLLGGLPGWFLSDFARRLNFAALTDDVIGMERHHLTRAGIVAALGLGIALLSSALRIYRLAFEVAVGLVLLAALGLTWLVIRLRKF